MKKLFFFSCCLLVVHTVYCQTNYTVYPTHWWIGMKNPHLQLMLHGKDIAHAIPQLNLSSSGIRIADGLTLQSVSKTENPNYVFLDLMIEKNAKAGVRELKLVTPDKQFSFKYELHPRRKGNGTSYAQGVRSQDFIYLIMPDRFANGNYNNDRIADMKDQSLNRDSMYHRHGGDLQGVMDHLDYLKELGVTTVWLTPILENDMPNRTEHGYAITNHYKVDERLGGITAYQQLSDALHKRGMKLIQDAVYNHCGLFHFFVQDPPSKEWLHQWKTFTQTNYKDQPLYDIHGSLADKKVMQDGWFTRQMPDLNQSNPFVANFLIQHAIWSVEEFGVDGWRIDTYIYNDLDFMNRCNQALLDEYPHLTMFGETWVHGTANQAYFGRNHMETPFKSNLIGVTDFQTNFYGINPALTQNFGWTEGVNRLYQTLAGDFLYDDPMNNVIFLDNHDMTRFLSQVNGDQDKLKMGIGWLLTCRGIPEMYYGTEILMKGISNPDGLVRGDFPGGWKEDLSNKFEKVGRTELENNMFVWTKTLANFRKNSSAITTGRMMQFAPENWVYTYFRYDQKQTVMVIMNTSTEERIVDPTRFGERLKTFTKGKNIISNDRMELNTTWNLPGKTIWILELEK